MQLEPSRGREQSHRDKIQMDELPITISWLFRSIGNGVGSNLLSVLWRACWPFWRCLQASFRHKISPVDLVCNTAPHASQVILQRCLPQGWAARTISFTCFLLYLAFFSLQQASSSSCLYTLTAFEKYAIRLEAPREKRRKSWIHIPSVMHFAWSAVVWLMDYPFGFGFCGVQREYRSHE